MEKCSSDQIGVSAAIVKIRYCEVVLERLGLSPDTVLVVSSEGVETSELMPSSAECWGSVEVKTADIGAHHRQTEEVVFVDAID